MRIKSVVKVMNFHALLRVDRSRKTAEKYMSMEKELLDMMDVISNNRNLILDKKIWKVDSKKEELKIYFGSDYGFCGSVNSQVNQRLLQSNVNSSKITIGKKLRNNATIDLRLTREQFNKEYEQIHELLKETIEKKVYSKIYIIYNHYHNMSHIELVEKCIYPIEPRKSEGRDYNEDMSIEGDVEKIIKNMLVTYLDYEVKIAAINSFASENILRQNSTQDSLKKIEENEEEEKKQLYKIKTKKSFEKVIDAYTKKKGFEGR